ncbi:hypothetical protein ACQKKE_07885 [Desemzia incerta]|uniref:hypothetical protein n=1 Tax=Desemzia incerta TaxID=82801 RepID=UPI003D09350F
MEKHMYYIIAPINLIILLCYPYFVPRYFTLNSFLITWLVYVAVSSLIIKVVLNHLKKHKNKKML